jgi:aldehyde dehydrogenase (NAD+)
MTQASTIEHTKLLIDGEWRDAANGDLHPVINPATEEVICEVPSATREDLEAAAQAARRAFHAKEWKKMGGPGRSKALWKLADLIEREMDQIATLETINQGKPIFESRKIDMPFLIQLFRYYAGWADKLGGETIPVQPGFLNYTLKEPVGVVGMIVPWNFPLLLTCYKLAPALAAGCTAVIKPAEYTPLTALKLGALCLEAGFPPGAVNVVTGKGSVIGQAMLESPDIDKIAFTGSTETGRNIMRGAASTIKRVSLELGGKSPNIVFPDAKLDWAANGACGGIFYNKGEVCTAGSRLFVHKSVHDEFLDVLSAKIAKYTPGDPLDEKTRLGPQVSSSHRDGIMAAVERGKNEGVTVYAGGNATTVNGKGYFVEPTVLTEVKNDMSVAQEEIFGPVLCVLSFDEEEEAVAWANKNCYGLASGVWTQDPARAHRVAAALQAGTVWVNTYNLFHPASPFGGYKESGFGRELGREGLDQYMETKSIWVSMR